MQRTGRQPTELNAALVRLALMTLIALLVPACDSTSDLFSGVGAVRKPVFTEQGTEACLGCHFDESMQSIADGPHGETEHACETCHGPGSFHVSGAHGGKGLPPLTDFGQGPEASPRDEQLHVCLACHEFGDSGASLIAFTGSAHDLSSINCSACHRVHTEPAPTEGVQQRTAPCLICHTNLQNDHPQIGRKPFDPATRPCARCHKIHRPDKKRND